MRPLPANILFKGGIILLIAFNLYSFLNFVFQFFMARLLTLSDYGILATVFSIIYILGIFTESIQTIITRYTASEYDKGKLKNILTRSLKRSLLVSSLVFFLFILIAIPLSSIIKIRYSLLFLSGFIVFGSLLTPITRGVMQGTKRFFSLGINMVSESIMRLALGIAFVLAGFGLYGAVGAMVVALLFSFLISFISLKDVMNSRERTLNVSGIYAYSKPTFILLLSVTVFYSIDIILVRILFPSDLAGAYAISSILAKAVFWGTHPISRAMFPLSAERELRNKESKDIFYNAFFFLLGALVIALAFFYFFPDVIVHIFSGKVIAESSHILFMLGATMAIISITNLVWLYSLSTKKSKAYFLTPLFICVEVVMMTLFSSDLVSFSLAFFASSVIFLIASVILIRR